MDALTFYRWPCNVRELINAIDYAFVLYPGGGISKEHLPVKIMSENDCFPVDNIPKTDHSDDRETLLELLRDVAWNQSEAARKLGGSRVTVWKWIIKKYNLVIHFAQVGCVSRTN